MSTKKSYPAKVCYDCGTKASKGECKSVVACWENGICEVCEQFKIVTEPGYFFYPEFPMIK